LRKICAATVFLLSSPGSIRLEKTKNKRRCASSGLNKNGFPQAEAFRFPIILSMARYRLHPLTADLDISLVNMPSASYGLFTPVETFQQQRGKVTI